MPRAGGAYGVLGQNRCNGTRIWTYRTCCSILPSRYFVCPGLWVRIDGGTEVTITGSWKGPAKIAFYFEYTGGGWRPPVNINGLTSDPASVPTFGGVIASGESLTFIVPETGYYNVNALPQFDLVVPHTALGRVKGTLSFTHIDVMFAD